MEKPHLFDWYFPRAAGYSEEVRKSETVPRFLPEIIVPPAMRAETQEFLPPRPSRVLSLQQKSFSVASVTVQNLIGLQTVQNGC